MTKVIEIRISFLSMNIEIEKALDFDYDYLLNIDIIEFSLTYSEKSPLKREFLSLKDSKDDVLKSMFSELERVPIPC